MLETPALPVPQIGALPVPQIGALPVPQIGALPVPQIGALPVPQIALVLASGAILAIAWRVIDPARSIGVRCRQRFLFGIPWGTLATIGVVAVVYLTLQTGLSHWSNPLVIPYRAWSYWYPLGIVTSGLAHASPGHLVGNLTATLAFAPIAEFAWGHFPPGRGRSPFGRWRDHPIVRIATVPVAAIACAVVTAAFAWGPVIGFSGVVFAFVGVALVRHPVGTLLALVLGQGIGLSYRALIEPVTTASAGVTYTTPWWARIALQGHLAGLIIGILVGLALATRRDWRLSTAWIWTATIGVALEQGLWAVYWTADQGYRLFRAAGVVAILALATVVAATTVRGLVLDDPIGRAVDGTPLDRLDWGVPTRGTAITVLVGVLVVTSFVGAAVNLETTPDPATGAVDIEDYRVDYDEQRTTHQISAFDAVIPWANLSWNRSASGVIVTSARRSIWTVAVPADRLQRSNRATVVIGGHDWRREILVRRRGWAVPGNRSSYAVDLRPRGGQRHRAYRSAPTTANLTVDGRRVRIAPTGGRFAVIVDGPNGTARDRIPWPGERTTVGAVTIAHVDGSLYASHDDTRVRIAGRIGPPLDSDRRVVTLDRDAPPRRPAVDQSEQSGHPMR